MENLPQEILEFVKNHHQQNPDAGIHIKNAIIDYKDLTQVYVDGLNKENVKAGRGIELIFCFDNAIVTYQGEEPFQEPVGVIIKCGYKTPKGYFSTKMIPVTVVDTQNLTLEETLAMWEFRTDAKRNTYDPFWHENQARSREGAAWNYIATHYITDPYCTR